MSQLRRAGRVGDCAVYPASQGGSVAVQGSQNVLVNSRPALRMGDSAMCVATQAGIAHAVGGSRSVLINNKPAHRQWDQQNCCGEAGQLAFGSSNVAIGDQTTKDVPPTKVQIQIVHAGGTPASSERYELLDSHGNIVAAGRLDQDGWLRVEGVQWQLHTVRLPSGLRITLRGTASKPRR